MDRKIIQIMPAPGWFVDVRSQSGTKNDSLALIGWALCEVTDEDDKSLFYQEVIGLVQTENGLVELCNEFMYGKKEPIHISYHLA